VVLDVLVVGVEGVEVEAIEVVVVVVSGLVVVVGSTCLSGVVEVPDEEHAATGTSNASHTKVCRIFILG
jgi:hypothetical protein